MSNQSTPAVDSYMELNLLGPLELRADDGRLIDIAAPKRRAVFALLSLERNQVVSTERLITLVWGRCPPAQVRTALHVHISGLRKLLDSSMSLETHAPGYLLRTDPTNIDIARFADLVTRADGLADDTEAAALLRQAISLWRGPALADVQFPNDTPAVVAGFEEARLVALQRLADRLLRLGRSVEVHADLATAVAAHPLREPLIRVQMLALHADGRQTDAFAVYHRTRERLADELGVDPSACLQDAYQLVLRTEPSRPAPAASVRVPRQPSRRGTVPASRVPTQLPRGPAGFVGRQDELDALDGLRETEDSSRPILLAGEAGVGKTALALRWAHRVACHYPDGQLFVNLRGFDETAPLAPEEALAGFLRALGVPEQELPQGTEDRAALYRGLLNQRRMLIILDNARSAAQVRSLLPGGSGCTVLVTSRHQLAGLVVAEGATPLTLPVLPEDEALGLLAKAVGDDRVVREPRAAHCLVDLCDRLPLALRIAAARLAVHPLWTIQSLVAELSDEQERIAALATDDTEISVLAALQLSCRALSPPQARLLRLLGAHPGTEVDEYAAAALIGTDQRIAHRLLSGLLGANLVAETESGRFVRHDLVRLFTRHLLDTETPADERRQAIERLLDYYLQATAEAAEHTTPQAALLHRPLCQAPAATTPGLGAGRALDWFATEEHAIRRLIAATATEYPEHAWRLADNATSLYFHGGNAHDWVTLSRDGLRAVERCGSGTGEVRIRSQLGVGLTQLGEHEEARTQLTTAVRKAEELGESDQVCLALIRLGSVDLAVRDLDSALAHCRRALAISERIGDALRTAQIQNNLGHILILHGDPDNARKCAQRALSLLADRKPHHIYSSAMQTYGQSLDELGRREEAVAVYGQALADAREHRDELGEAQCRHALGIILAGMGRIAEATDHLHRALRHYARLGLVKAVEVKAELTRLEGSPAVSIPA